MLLLLCGQPGQSQAAEVWVFFRPDIPLHVATLNHLKEKTEHDLVFCPVGKTTFSFLESRPPACAVVLGDAAQQLALSMLWKVKILVTLVDQPSADKRVVFLNTSQPAALQIEMLKNFRKDLAVIWYPYVSERFAPDAGLSEAATANGVRIEACRLADPRKLPKALHSLNATDTAAILPPDPGIMNDAIIKAILLSSFRSRTPVAGFSDAMARQGAAFAYILSPENLAGALSEHIDEIVENRQLPDQHKVFKPWHLILNVTVLEKLNFSVPENIRHQAKKIY